MPTEGRGSGCTRSNISVGSGTPNLQGWLLQGLAQGRKHQAESKKHRMSLVTRFWREIRVPVHSAASPPSVLRTKSPLRPHLNPSPRQPNLQLLHPNKDSADPCPAPSGDRAPPPFLVSPGPSSEDEQPRPGAFPALPRPGPAGSRLPTHPQRLSYLRVVPAVAAGPASERTLQNGDGRSSLGATERFLARQLTHARVRAARLPSPS